MEMISLMRAIVPGDLFDFPEEGDSVERAQYLIDQCFPGATRMRLQQLSKDQAQAEIPFDMQNRALHGLMHGGCYFTVGDTLTAIMCMYQVQKPTERMLTVNASIRYLRPVDRDTVQARARLAHSQDNRYDFVVDFFNENNKRAAQAKFTYVVAELG